MTSHRMTRLIDIWTFVIGGNATFTLRSAKTGARYTYQVRHPEGKPFFVQLLTGSDNETSYTYMGVLDPYTFELKLTAKSRYNDSSTPVRALRYLLKRLRSRTISDQLEFWHEGSCGRCGRKLTDPESIERGIGPTCVGLMTS